MGKPRDLANVVATGNILADGAVAPAELTGVTSTAAELNILDGVTATAAELNLLDGVTATTAELNYVDGVTSNVQTQMDTKAPVASPTFTGRVTAPTVNASTALEIGGTAITATAAELNIMDGVTATASELNIMDGVTSTTAELNILDGVTSTAAELNILDGVTATTAELNILDGVTATATELNYVDGVTSSIQTQLNTLQAGFTTNVITGNTTATKDNHYYLNGSAITLTLPASPSVGDEVRISEVAGNTNNIIGRNSSNIMSAAADLTIDTAYLVISLRYVNSTIGWAFS